MGHGPDSSPTAVRSRHHSGEARPDERAATAGEGQPGSAGGTAARDTAARDTAAYGADGVTGIAGQLRRLRIPPGHRLFAVMLAAAVAVRLVAVAGFTPALYFNDSYEYVGVALRPQPYTIRPSGYSFFLMALQPFHSLQLVVVLQHLMGLAIGVMVYALLRRYGVAAWIAVAATAPHLFDVYQIQLEHMILSETLFTFLVVVALVALLWRRRVPTWACLLAGGLLAMASLTRAVGVPLALVAAVWLLTRRPGLRPFLAFTAALTVPLVAYAGWYWSFHGTPGLTGSDGIFLYSRTTSFADCSRIHPPPDLAVLCPAEPVGARRPPSDYIWHGDLPLASFPGPVFGGYKDSLAGDFAVHAVVRQPLDYARVVARDAARSFGPRLTDHPSPKLTNHYLFQDPPIPILESALVPGGGPDDVRAYDRSDANPRAIAPMAGWLITYQRHIIVPGKGLGLMLLVSLVGLAASLARRLLRLARRWRRRPHRSQPSTQLEAMEATMELKLPGSGKGAHRRSKTATPSAGNHGPPAAGVPLFLITAATITLLLVPPLTAGFDHRYVTPTIALLGAGAGLAVQVLRRSVRTEKPRPPLR